MSLIARLLFHEINMTLKPITEDTKGNEIQNTCSCTKFAMFSYKLFDCITSIFTF